METLPTDILENIFFRLDTDSTMQSKLVCKTWRRIIGNKVGLLFMFRDAVLQLRPDIQLYYGDPKYEINVENYYSKKTLTILSPGILILEPNIMVGSCNGLVCFKASYPISAKEGLAFICNNPITGEVCCIPELKKPGSEPPVGGFGYVGSTNEYKVVRIRFKNWAAYVQVYTLGSRLGWRDKGNVPCVFSADESGIFANGALHWINTKGVPGRNCKILAFRLADEKFWPVPSPPFNHNNRDNCSTKLILLGGNLCVVQTNHQSVNKRLDIWAFKKTNKSTSNSKANEKPQEVYYDHTWSWSKEYSIKWEGEVMYTPFVITKRNTVLLWQKGTSNLSCYDPKTSTLQKYWDEDKRDSVYVQAIPHTNSHVSLEDLGEASHKPKEPVLEPCCPSFVFNSFRMK